MIYTNIAEDNIYREFFDSDAVHQLGISIRVVPAIPLSAACTRNDSTLVPNDLNSNGQSACNNSKGIQEGLRLAQLKYYAEAHQDPCATSVSSFGAFLMR